MTEKPLRYPTVLFDWGDTVMRDYPEITTPMVEWETVEIVEGIADLLAYLHSSGRRIALATSAAISDENQIQGAVSLMACRAKIISARVVHFSEDRP